MTFTVLKYIAFIPKWLRIFIMKGAVFCQIIFMSTLRWLCNFYSFVNVMIILQFSCSVMSDSVTHESQHSRPPCPSPTPWVHPDSCPSIRWCHSSISSSVVTFSSCPQSLPASESFLMSQHFTWGGQSIGVSASATVLPVNTQDWSPLGWTGWISFKS